MKSAYLKTFIKEIQYKNRNPQNTKALELLDDKTTNPEIVIDANSLLYRCRVVTDISRVGKEENFYGYNAKDSFAPPPERTRDLRANYRYIPYLYCANNPYVALAEVRPRLGAMVSIATIVTKEPITLLDLTLQQKPPKMTAAKVNLFQDLSILYSTPVTNDDDILDYIPTQYIAEYAKSKHYDGIAFSSSVVPEINKKHPERYNVVVFNFDKCEVVRSNLISVGSINFECEQVDQDAQKINVISYIEEELDAIHEYQTKLIGEQKQLVEI